MPHQGFVSLIISVLSICLTLCVVFYSLWHEKRNQAQNSDKH